jgi:glycosyltransferase involved in cell wall biosynthesis
VNGNTRPSPDLVCPDATGASGHCEERWYRARRVDLILYPGNKDVVFAAGPPYVMGIHRCLGYVAEEDISGLYAAAQALIMPTFFGPTNFPVLEAWALGCPVLSADVRGIRGQAG